MKEQKHCFIQLCKQIRLAINCDEFIVRHKQLSIHLFTINKNSWWINLTIFNYDSDQLKYYTEIAHDDTKNYKKEILATKTRVNWNDYISDHV